MTSGCVPAYEGTDANMSSSETNNTTSTTTMTMTKTKTKSATTQHKDSMKSTWRTEPSTWTISHKVLNFLDAFSSFEDQAVPVFRKDEKVPYLSEIQTHRWVLCYAFLPMALHQAITWLTGRNLGYITTFFLYSFAYKGNALVLVRLLRRLGHVYGFYDGDQHSRDGVPDNKVDRVLMSLEATTFLRPAMLIALAYRVDQAPTSINLPWLAVEVGAYSVILDFFFYWYHRSMHEFDSLWKFHRTHHLTKHPIALLSAFADEEQEFIDMVGCPLATFVTMRLIGFPMGFYEWWVCFEYVIFSEALGHSGLRVGGTPPSSVSALLWLFGCELMIEDHDLHHRFGYKTSGNYGKQTRLWDRVFGTCKDRMESKRENVDFSNRVELPLLF